MDKRQNYQKDELHIGKLIKSELVRQGKSITWLSKQINCTRENLYKVFRRPWIYTDLLFEISKTLNHDFFKDCSEYYIITMKIESECRDDFMLIRNEKRELL